MDMPIFTGRVVEEMDLVGYLMPWDAERGRPVILDIKGWRPRARLVPVFSSEALLREAFTWIDHPRPITIKQILDTREFMSRFPPESRIIVGADVYRYGDRVRWLAVVATEDPGQSRLGGDGRD